MIIFVLKKLEAYDLEDVVHSGDGPLVQRRLNQLYQKWANLSEKEIMGATGATLPCIGSRGKAPQSMPGLFFFFTRRVFVHKSSEGRKIIIFTSLRYRSCITILFFLLFQLFLWKIGLIIALRGIITTLYHIQSSHTQSNKNYLVNI